MALPSSILTTYVPQLLQRRLLRQQGAAPTPQAEAFAATVLFADISGFTALSERLAERGPIGAEALSRVLNGYFGQLIDIILAHGGDVVKFAGDGLLALWPRAADRAALACACAIQTQLHAAHPVEGQPLGLRIGLSAGEVNLAQLGGLYGRWEFLLTGEPLTRVSQAEQQAQPGEVILAAELAAEWASELVGDTLPEGWYKVRVQAGAQTKPAAPRSGAETSSLTEDSLRAYIPNAILARLRAGYDVAEWLTELRRVTVLFINLPDLNHTIALEQAQAVMRALQASLYRFEGSINKLNLDDKGVTLVAALGLPPLAHEDDAVRGLQAAWQVQAQLQTLGFRTAIGLTTGRAFCGAVGNDQRREYTMLGDVVNLAARLMQAAGQPAGQPADRGQLSVAHSILCDSATYQRAQRYFEFEKLAPVVVKGKAEPVAVFQPTAQKSLKRHLEFELPHIGRAVERAAIDQALKGLVNGGPGGLLLIRGEPGLGKSRLMAEAQQQAGQLGLTVFVGAGDAVEKTTPYHAWREIFAQLLDLHLFTDPEKRRRHVRLAMGPERLRLAPLLNDLLPLELPANEYTEKITGQARATQTRDLLVSLLRASVVRSPKVIILEDAHWLDSASWALALAVCQQVRPLVLMLATRPLADPTPSEYNQLLHEPSLQVLQLAALSPTETQALICQRLGVPSLPEAVARLLREKAEGHPFFSEELIFALRDGGHIVIEDGACHLAPNVNLAALSLPDTVQGAITSRIDRLTPPQQLALKVASVIGRVFAFNVLEAIYPIAADRPRLRAYLDALARLDLTPLDLPEPDLSYIFKHIITQEVAYSLMLFAQRHELHQAVAEWHEHTYTHSLEAHYPILAYHWSQANHPAKAAHYALGAGENAAKLSAYLEARAHYMHGLEQLAHLPASAENHRQRIDAIFKLVELSYAAEHTEVNFERVAEAEALLAELPEPDPIRVARAHYWRGRLHFYRGAVREALGHFQQVSAHAPALTAYEQAILNTAYGRVLYLQGRFGQAGALFEAAIPALEQTQDWSEWLAAVGYLAGALAAQGHPPAALALMTRFLDFMRASGALAHTNASGYIYVATVHLYLGDWFQGLAAAQTAHEIALRSNDQLWVYIALALEATAQVRLGQAAAAQTTLAHADQVAETLGGQVYFVSQFKLLAAELALAEGDLAGSEARIAAIVQQAQRTDEIYTAGLGHRLWMSVLAAHPAPAWEAVDAHFAEAERCLQECAANLELARVRLIYGRLCASRGDAARARAQWELALAQFTASDLPAYKAEAQGLLQTLAKDNAELTAG